MDQYKKDQLKILLEFYFRTVWEKAGLKWDYDNSSEIETIVDLIFDN